MIKKPKKKKILTLTTIIALAVVLNILITGINNIVLSETHETREEIKHYETKLTSIKKSVNQNRSILNESKKGNSYKLHNPLLEEVNDFLTNEYNTNASIVISNAKNKGLRCAYVQVIISELLIVRELIGFNISNSDDDMKYYEIKNHYQIEPAIGLNYSECFISGELDDPIYNQKIRDIITIW